MKDEFKINIFFDENGPTFEEIIMDAFEEKLLILIFQLIIYKQATDLYSHRINPPKKGGKKYGYYINMENKK